MVANPTRAVSQCAGKYRFGSYTRAAQVARRKGRRRDTRYMPYACETCGGFHIGTNFGQVEHPRRIDPRQSYRVYARDPGGKIAMVGWSREADGGRVAEVVRADGWEVSAVVPRHRGPR